MDTSNDDKRNVIDRFKGWSNELIKDDLKKNMFPCAVLMEQFAGDYNIGTVLRNSNAFNATATYYMGKRQWDRRGSCGVQNYSKLIHINRDQLIELKKEYVLVGLDNVAGSIPMEDFIWPIRTMMIFGEEGHGITKETLEICDDLVAITQYGSVRSLNAGTASGIALYDYTSKSTAMNKLSLL